MYIFFYLRFKNRVQGQDLNEYLPLEIILSIKIILAIKKTNAESCNQIKEILPYENTVIPKEVTVRILIYELIFILNLNLFEIQGISK